MAFKHAKTAKTANTQKRHCHVDPEGLPAMKHMGTTYEGQTIILDVLATLVMFLSTARAQNIKLGPGTAIGPGEGAWPVPLCYMWPTCAANKRETSG